MNINQWRRHILESELSDKGKLVAMVLSVYYRPDKIIYPTLSTLEYDCSLTRNTIIKATNELIVNKYISVKKMILFNNSFKSNVYSLIGVTSEPMNKLINKPVIEPLNKPSIIGSTSEPKKEKKIIKENYIKENSLENSENCEQLVEEKKYDPKSWDDIWDILTNNYPSGVKTGQIYNELKNKDQNGWFANYSYKGILTIALKMCESNDYKLKDQ